MSMEKSLHYGTNLIEQVWSRMKPGELPKLRECKEDRILVIEGSYDYLEKILDNAKVPYTLLDEFPDKEELRQGGQFAKSKVMFVNCDEDYHSSPEDKNLTRENKKSLQEFVARGGRMITTDWAQAVVKYLFGKIRAKENSTDDDDIVKVRFASDIGKNLSGISYGNARPNWWLESSSDMISYSKNSGVVELVESYEMKEKYGSSHVAVGFPYGEGEVFHFVSHLIAQELKNYDESARECLRTFLDLTKTSLKSASTSKLSFGEIETTYTLMHTVLELCRNKMILPKGRELLKGGVA